MTIADFEDIPERIETAPRPAMTPFRVTALCAAMVAIGPLAMALYTPAMPAIGAQWGVSADAVKMTLTAYFAGFALAQLVSGPLSDALGRKATLLGFFSLFSVATLWALLSGSIEQLIAARALQGVGASAGIAVSRALVRDLFTGEKSSHVMNGIGITLALGPAVAPIVGGLTLEVLPWPAVFAIMLVYALGVMLAIHRMQTETVTRDLSRFRPVPLARSYGLLLRSPAFLASSMMLAGAVGTIYAQAPLLPFALIERVGLTPSEFGAAMMFQTGSFFLGSVTVRRLMATRKAAQLAPIGLMFFFAGGLASLPHLFGETPTLMNVMAPVAIYVFGVGFVMPFAMTAAMAPFPKIAGAASALSGFFQMGSGLVGGVLGAMFADPAEGLGAIAPVMCFIAAAGFLWWRSLPVEVTGTPPEL